MTSLVCIVIAGVQEATRFNRADNNVFFTPPVVNKSHLLFERILSLSD